MWVVLILFSSPSEGCFPLSPILWRRISWFSQLATRTCSHKTLECLHFCSGDTHQDQGEPEMQDLKGVCGSSHLYPSLQKG